MCWVYRLAHRRCPIDKSHIFFTVSIITTNINYSCFMRLGWLWSSQMGYLAHATLLFLLDISYLPLQVHSSVFSTCSAPLKGWPLWRHLWTPMPSSFQTGAASGCTGRRLGGGIRGKSGIYPVFILTAPPYQGASSWISPLPIPTSSVSSPLLVLISPPSHCLFSLGWPGLPKLSSPGFSVNVPFLILFSNYAVGV